jgi:hypothetical protein
LEAQVNEMISLIAMTESEARDALIFDINFGENHLIG